MTVNENVMSKLCVSFKRIRKHTSDYFISVHNRRKAHMIKVGYLNSCPQNGCANRLRSSAPAYMQNCISNSSLWAASITAVLWSLQRWFTAAIAQNTCCRDTRTFKTQFHLFNSNLELTFVLTACHWILGKQLISILDKTSDFSVLMRNHNCLVFCDKWKKCNYSFWTVVIVSD